MNDAADVEDDDALLGADRVTKAAGTGVVQVGHVNGGAATPSGCQGAETFGAGEGQGLRSIDGAKREENDSEQKEARLRHPGNYIEHRDTETQRHRDEF